MSEPKQVAQVKLSLILAVGLPVLSFAVTWGRFDNQAVTQAAELTRLNKAVDALTLRMNGEEIHAAGLDAKMDLILVEVRAIHTDLVKNSK